MGLPSPAVLAVQVMFRASLKGWKPEGEEEQCKFKVSLAAALHPSFDFADLQREVVTCAAKVNASTQYSCR